MDNGVYMWLVGFDATVNGYGYVEGRTPAL